MIDCVFFFVLSCILVPVFLIECGIDGRDPLEKVRKRNDYSAIKRLFGYLMTKDPMHVEKGLKYTSRTPFFVQARPSAMKLVQDSACDLAELFTPEEVNRIQSNLRACVANRSLTPYDVAAARGAALAAYNGGSCVP